MVIRTTIDNLKNQPKKDRVAVAGSIAIAVVTVLFLGWAIAFFHNMRSINPQTQPANSASQS